jgi:hypothetical protein
VVVVVEEEEEEEEDAKRQTRGKQTALATRSRSK